MSDEKITLLVVLLVLFIQHIYIDHQSYTDSMRDTGCTGEKKEEILPLWS